MMNENVSKNGEKVWLVRYLAKFAGVFAGCITLFFLLLVLVFSIPDDWVADKQQESLSLFDKNGAVDEWPFTRESEGWMWTFTHARGAQLDNTTDHTMILNVISDVVDASVFYKAMDCNGYARYWHGYLIFLRPLMLVFSYMQIRYIYMFVYMLLGVAILLGINRNFGKRMVYLWTLCICFINPVVLPFSLQFSSVFFITMVSILMVDRLYNKECVWGGGYNLQQLGLLFLVIGMLTSYIDFFTAPLLTLGIPLIYFMLLNDRKYRQDSFRKNMWSLVASSAAWGFGYFGCWGMKWLIASPILERNVIEEAMTSMIYRTVKTYHTKTGYDTGSLRAIVMNLFAILPPGITSADWKWFFGIILIIVLVLLVIFVKFHVGRQELKATIPFLVVAAYPYVWFMVIAQHTSIHYIFTYRIELMTLLGVFIAYGKSIRIRGDAVKFADATGNVR